MIVSKDDSIELTSESKPVRESLKANYGVSYIEDIAKGGSANFRIKGKSYYEVPGRTMKRNELEKR